MTGLKRVAGAYMVILAVAVAVYFITNNFLVDSIDVPGIWYVFDALMAVGLALALIFNYAHKREESESDLDGSVTRRYLDATALFYLTAAVTILFLHNWLSLLALGGEQPGWQSPGLGHLGDCRHAGAHHIGRHRDAVSGAKRTDNDPWELARPLGCPGLQGKRAAPRPRRATEVR